MKHGIIIAGSGRGLYFADLLARTPGLKESWLRQSRRGHPEGKS